MCFKKGNESENISMNHLKAQCQELYQWQQSKDGKDAKAKHFGNKAGGKKQTQRQLKAQINSLEKQISRHDGG